MIMQWRCELFFISSFQLISLLRRKQTNRTKLNSRNRDKGTKTKRTNKLSAHLLLLIDLALAARPLVQHCALQLRPTLPTLLDLPGDYQKSTYLARDWWKYILIVVSPVVFTIQSVAKNIWQIVAETFANMIMAKIFAKIFATSSRLFLLWASLSSLCWLLALRTMMMILIRMAAMQWWREW